MARGSIGAMLATVALAIVGLIVAPFAHAGVESNTVGGYTYLHDSSQLLSPPESGSAPTVFCPGSKTLIGLAGGIGSGVVGHVNSMYPLDGPDDGARANEAVAVDAHNASGAAKTIFAQAVCKGGKRRYVTNDRTVPEDTVRAFSARCPGGTHVTSGGGFVGGDIGSGRILSSTPFDSADAGTGPDDGWRVEVVNPAGAGEQDLTVHAICQERKVRYEVSDPSTLTAGQEMGVLGDCANEAHLITAGADLSLDPDAQVSAILLEDSSADPDAARDDIASFTLTHRDAGGVDAEYTLTEICARP